jgi:GntR family transcriptional regulator
MKQLADTYKRSRVPLYLQVATALRRRIEEGYWEPGQKISTLEELESEFQVARVTVRQAVDVLQKEGLVHRQQGKGTFVAEDIGDRRWLRLATTWSSLISTIEKNVPRFLKTEAPPPSPRLRPGDGRPAADYVFLRSLQSRGKEPYAVVNLHLARDIFERAPEKFKRHTALPIIAGMNDIKVARAHQTLTIGTADPDTARLLDLPLNAPTAEAYCVVVDESGVAIYVAEISYRGDCVKLDIDLLDQVGRRS